MDSSCSGGAFPLHYLTAKYDSWHDQQIIEAERNTEVFEVSDEPFRSAKGNLLGIRIRYSVRFPVNGTYSPGPRLLTAEESLRDFRGLTVLDASVDPAPSPLSDSLLPVPYGRYRTGVTYRFTFETVPFYLIPSRDRSGFCMSFADAKEEEFARSGGTTDFLVSVGGTSADFDLTGKSPLTIHSYRLGDFYEGAAAEGGRRPCHFDNQGNLH